MKDTADPVRQQPLSAAAGLRWMSRAGLLLVAALSGCTLLYLEDCPGRITGQDLPRLRTSRYRIELADPAAAAARVAPYALMSAYAYHDGAGCAGAGKGLPDDDAAELMQSLAAPSPAGPGWRLVPELGSAGSCEDEIGLLFHVWQRRVGDQDQLVIAFRGTSGRGDWLYGNLWWFTRGALADNQLTRARAHAERVITTTSAQARAEGRPPPLYFSTGHSLGGGLAQHVLYAHPRQVLQAIVFDPSSVTGFVDVPEASRRDGCACRAELGAEARFLRVYESYEVLSYLRIFHKLFNPPERHVQELRFPFVSAWNPVAEHSIVALARSLHAAARAAPADFGRTWLASKEASCTARVVQQQQQSCAVAVPPGALRLCPP